MDEFVLPKAADLLASARACLNNASSTLDDANLLMSRQRYHRAYALAILAQEEFAKCFMLCTCALQPRWDVQIWQALSQHERKQALVEVMDRYVNWFAQRNSFALRLNASALIPVPVSYTPDPEMFTTWSSEIRKRVINKRNIDSSKQRALYVAIGKNGKVSSEPSCTEEQVAAQLQKAITFQKVTDKQLKHIVGGVCGVGA